MSLNKIPQTNKIKQMNSTADGKDGSNTYFKDMKSLFVLQFSKKLQKLTKFNSFIFRLTAK